MTMKQNAYAVFASLAAFFFRRRRHTKNTMAPTMSHTGLNQAT